MDRAAAGTVLVIGLVLIMTTGMTSPPLELRLVLKPECEETNIALIPVLPASHGSQEILPLDVVEHTEEYTRELDNRVWEKTLGGGGVGV